ncbi:polymer-forming cytoskeletal protein [Gemmatimonadota bacterium DH-20]|uniref:Polymer-forming cytoskeletal protein n=1 Tax=Gaopeijia maritima TaxID=3119007 RepID=A0ABU9EDV5_9BACT
MRSRRGVVLVTVLLLLLAATLLVHGSVVLARAHHGGATAAWEAARVRRAAVGRLAAAVRDGGVTASSWSRAGPGVEATVRVVELGPELRLLAGGARGPRARWWVGRHVWRPDPAFRAAAVRAALTAASPTGGGGVVTGGAAGSCGGGRPLPTRSTPDSAGPRIGPLDLERLEGLAGVWTMEAGCTGGCAPRLGRSEGGVVTGGEHAGVLVSRGDLVLSGAARVRGHLLVEGALILRDSARVDGAVEVSGSVTLSPRSVIRGDRCAVADAWRDGVANAVGAVALEPRPWPLWGPPP